ncbi:sialate O-acetylesterase [uncultured Duncaniella sp.]|uniref:sialate O-acetylesterase n=1 Tax=uncultured Duncaniella sp. TaxID=2768039 RepID=UPI0026182473|nr:sialate O-acetylesterase [uncultured Duncaniella sp.]
MVNRPDPDFHVYLCLGQSNMEGAAPYEAVDTSSVSPRFRMMSVVNMPSKNRVAGRWYSAVPPLVRENTGLCPADYFGRSMVEALPEKVRVGVINVAVGGCKIELFNPDSYADHIESEPDWLKNTVKAYKDNPYKRLVEMAREAQRTGVIKGILLHQGESNTGDSEWPAKVKAVYDRLIADLGLDAECVPLVAGEMLSKEEGGVCDSMNGIVATLPQHIPNATVVSSKGCPGAPDGLHFTSEGYRELGRRYASAMLRLVNTKK